MNALAALACVLLAGPAAAAPSFMDLGRGQEQDPVDAALAALSNKPPLARLELRELYARYADVVRAKREVDGWKAGLETGAVVERAGERNMPARQAQDALKLRRAELRRLEESRDALKGPFQDSAREDARLEIDKKKRAVRAAQRLTERTMGLASDWSDLIWSEMLKLDPEHWSVADAVRDAQPRHTAAVLCTPAEDPTFCVALDPWRRGEPDVYEYGAWAKGDWSGRLPAEFFLHHLPEKRRP